MFSDIAPENTKLKRNRAGDFNMLPDVFEYYSTNISIFSIIFLYVYFVTVYKGIHIDTFAPFPSISFFELLRFIASFNSFTM